MSVTPRAASLVGAARRLRRGELVAFPTETLWGLGADAGSALGVARLQRFKERPVSKPLPVLVSRLPLLAPLGVSLSPRARHLAEHFWPGPLTLVLPSSARFPSGVARADGALGVRCSPHPTARELAGRLEALGRGPLIATSLNRAGEPPATTQSQADRLCRGGPDDPQLVAPPPPGVAEAGGEAPSTVLDLCGRRPRVLRWGALRPETLSPWLVAP